MIKIFKHTFIPHEQNDYKPHFFREFSITTILILVIVLFGISFGTKIYIDKTNMTSAVLPAVLVDLANNARTSGGQLALAKNSLLEKAATLKAEDMAANGYFAHTSPQGVTPWAWFNKVGYYFIYAGENLAIDFTESENVGKAWLNSPTHKANILNNKFTEIGIATKEGYYNGHPTIYVVQMFGTPAFASKEIKITPTPATTTEITTTTGPISTSLPKVVVKNNLPATTIAVAPVVKGESTVAPLELETITETDEFISVKNTTIDEEIVPINQTENVKYSTPSQRFLFMFPEYTNNVYQIIVWVVLIALILMLFIEIRRQHPKNIMYGILLIVIIFCFIYINQSMFVNFILV